MISSVDDDMVGGWVGGWVGGVNLGLVALVGPSHLREERSACLGRV